MIARAAFIPWMSRSRSVLFALLLISLRPAASGAAWPRDPSENVKVTPAATSQSSPVIASDGAGGAIVAWIDNRGGADANVYAQRMGSNGTPLWGAGGVAVCTAGGNQELVRISSDQNGGAVIAWTDERNGGFANADVYAQRLNSSGVPQWTPDGVAICTAAGQQLLSGMAGEGVGGGAIIVWSDGRAGVGNTDIYAQWVDAAGVTRLAANGLAICTAPFSQSGADVASDGITAYFTWTDNRAGVDIYAQALTLGATSVSWIANGIPICNFSGNQDIARIAAENDAAIIAWRDGRAGLTVADIYAQKVDVSGAIQWAAGGVPVCTAAGMQWGPNAIVADGGGGAFLVWDDSRDNPKYAGYAQRLDASGAAQWATNGIAVSQMSSYYVEPHMVPDDSGGVIVSWHHDFSNAPDLYAQKLNPIGVPQWSRPGIFVSNAPGNQMRAEMISDGNGGAVLAWPDGRSGSDIYAQGVLGVGCLGATAPSIASVRDVPNDQGGRVKVSWEASGFDFAPIDLIDSYWIWRAAPPNLVAAAGASHSLPDVGRESGFGGRVLTASRSGANSYYWEYVASQPSGHIAHYSYVASTTSDSTGTANPFTAFMIQARDASGGQWWYSTADSGYSVDNLAPPAPTAFTGQYIHGTGPARMVRSSTSGFTWLHWSRQSESDFSEFHLHRGTFAGFVPSSSNLLTAQPDTGFKDYGAAGGYYKLMALDLHGNVSTASVLTPADIAGVGASPLTAAVQLAIPRPNPALSLARIGFELPTESRASLAILDVSGRRVRAVLNQDLPAGAHEANWNLTDDAGVRVGAGLYFVELRTAQGSFRRKLAVVP